MNHTGRINTFLKTLEVIQIAILIFMVIANFTAPKTPFLMFANVFTLLIVTLMELGKSFLIYKLIRNLSNILSIIREQAIEPKAGILKFFDPGFPIYEIKDRLPAEVSLTTLDIIGEANFKLWVRKFEKIKEILNGIYVPKINSPLKTKQDGFSFFNLKIAYLNYRGNHSYSELTETGTLHVNYVKLLFQYTPKQVRMLFDDLLQDQLLEDSMIHDIFYLAEAVIAIKDDHNHGDNPADIVKGTVHAIESYANHSESIKKLSRLLDDPIFKSYRIKEVEFNDYFRRALILKFFLHANGFAKKDEPHLFLLAKLLLTYRSLKTFSLHDTYEKLLFALINFLDIRHWSSALRRLTDVYEDRIRDFFACGVGRVSAHSQIVSIQENANRIYNICRILYDATDQDTETNLFKQFRDFLLDLLEETYAEFLKDPQKLIPDLNMSAVAELRKKYEKIYPILEHKKTLLPLITNDFAELTVKVPTVVPIVTENYIEKLKLGLLDDIELLLSLKNVEPSPLLIARIALRI